MFFSDCIVNQRIEIVPYSTVADFCQRAQVSPEDFHLVTDFGNGGLLLALCLGLELSSYPQSTSAHCELPTRPS